MIRKRPLYGGQKRGLGCFLTKTWEQFWSPGVCRYPAVERIMLAAYKVHSFTELLAEGPWFKVAGLDKVCGEASMVLLTISAMMQYRSSLKNVWMLRRTSGSCLTHLLLAEEDVGAYFV